MTPDVKYAAAAYLISLTTLINPGTSASTMAVLVLSMMLVSASFWLVFVYALDRQTIRDSIDRSQKTIDRLFGGMLCLPGLRVALVSRLGGFR